MISHTILLLCVISAVTRIGDTLPNEVPFGACKDMKPKGPGHRYADPQSSKHHKAPYEYHLTEKKISGTQSVEFTIRAKDDDKPFQGFMIQVRDSHSENPELPIGSFWPKGDDSRTVTCSNPYDTGSHNSPNPKTSVTMIWNPPDNFHGKATFFVTVAQTKYVYWQKIEAEHVHVKKADD